MLAFSHFSSECLAVFIIIILILTFTSCFLSAAASASIDAVLTYATKVSELIDQDDVAKKLGVNVDKDDTAAVADRKEAETKKAALIEAYSASASAALDRLKSIQKQISDQKSKEVLVISGDPIIETQTQAATITHEENATTSIQVEVEVDLVALHDTATKCFELCCKQLQKWDDLNAVQHWLLCIGRLKLKNQWGLALKKINDLSAAAADNKSKGDPVPRETLYEVR